MNKVSYLNAIVKTKFTGKYYFYFELLNKFLIESSKPTYYQRLSITLSNPSTNPKTFWSILKTIPNNWKMSSIYALPHENKFVFDFKKKAELFNPTFVLQCSLISNDSTTPCSSETRAENCLFTVDVTHHDVAKIIKNFNAIKAYGYDAIICIMTVCGVAICKSIEIMSLNGNFISIKKQILITDFFRYYRFVETYLSAINFLWFA